MLEFISFWGVIIALLILFFSSAIRVVQEYERGVIFRLGRFVGARGPGLFFIIPIIERMEKVDLRVVTADVPTQEAITRDNVTVKVNAVIYFRVVDPGNAVLKVMDHMRATSQLAQTTLRSVLGQSELDELLSNRDQINQRLRKIIDEGTEPWGVKVTLVEVRDVELPQSLQRAMAAQASAERERRAKIIHADGEFQASAKLAEAAAVLASEPGSMQLRYLQTLTEISSDKSNTIVFPLPMDLVKDILDRVPVSAGKNS